MLDMNTVLNTMENTKITANTLVNVMPWLFAYAISLLIVYKTSESIYDFFKKNRKVKNKKRR